MGIGLFWVVPWCGDPKTSVVTINSSASYKEETNMKKDKAIQSESEEFKNSENLFTIGM